MTHATDRTKRNALTCRLEAFAQVLQSIFLDVLLVISAPIARNLAPKIGKFGTARMAAALAIGLECGIVLMVPGVGALALAGLLGVPLGEYLIYGLILIILTVTIAVAIMSFLFTCPTTISLLLIAIGAILQVAEIENPVIDFISDPVMALLIGLIGTSFVGRFIVGQKRMEKAIVTGFGESGQILILTGVGGSLAATISAAGLGDILGQYFTAHTAAPLLMVWLIAAALHVAVGSVTICAHHRRGYPRADPPRHRARPDLHRAGRGRRLIVRLPRHQQHLRGCCSRSWARPPGHTEDVLGRRLGSLRRRHAAHPANERRTVTQIRIQNQDRT